MIHKDGYATTGGIHGAIPPITDDEKRAVLALIADQDAPETLASMLGIGGEAGGLVQGR